MTTTNNPESHTWQCEQVETLTDYLQPEPSGKVQSLFHVTVHKGFPFKLISFYLN